MVMSKEDKDYTNVLLEEMNSKFDLLLEMMQPIKKLQEDTSVLIEDIQTVKSDVKKIKTVVTDQSKQLTNHEVRIIDLETA